MTPRRQTALEMTEAASAWLGSLTDDQRAVAHGAVPAYDDPVDAERRRWFYTPTDHGGLTVHQQRPAQQQAAMRLVATGLSMAGYVTVATTMGLENVLDRVEGFVTRFDRERGRDPGLYYLRVFGEPGGVDVGVAVRWAPCLAQQPRCRRRARRHDPVLHGRRPGVQPASRRRGQPAARPGRGPRPRAGALPSRRARRAGGPAGQGAIGLGHRQPRRRFRRATRSSRWPASGASGFPTTTEQAKLQALSDAIDEAAGTHALKTSAPSSTPPRPRASPAATSTTPNASCCWPCSAPTSTGSRTASRPFASYDDAALDAVHFAWAGPTDPGLAHYYRLQGPRLLIEWDNTQRGANHAHSVWRDPEADFGLDVLAQHRAAHH